MIHWKVTKKRGSGESAGSMVFNSYFKGKIRRFRKQSGIWTKQMARMSVQIFGKVYRHDGYSKCIPPNLVDTFDKTKSYKREYMRKERDHWNQYIWVKSCEVGATFNVNGYIFTKYLK